MQKLKKSTLILISINLILLLLISISKCTNKNTISRQTRIIRLVPKTIINEIDEIILKLPKNLASPLLDEFRIIKRKEAFLLKRNYGEFYIHPELIERFFSVLNMEEHALFITDNFREYDAYAVDELSAFNIRFVSKNKDILDLYIGKLDVTGQLRYIRRGNVASSVLCVSDAISPFLNTLPSFWLDMQLYKAKLNNNQINGIEINGNKVLRTFEKEKDFVSLEKALSSLTAIDIFDNLPIKNKATQNFT
ncbi:MAG: DUF4340 domain-containing protein, partial [Treponema sp.]